VIARDMLSDGMTINLEIIAKDCRGQERAGKNGEVVTLPVKFVSSPRKHQDFATSMAAGYDRILEGSK
jgi:hypothetical protein